MKGRPDPPPTLIAQQLGARACGVGRGDLHIPTALYLLYDAQGVLLYVGITRNLLARMRRHGSMSPWWHEVSRGWAVWYASEAGAGAEEHWAIVDLNPKYNIHKRIQYLPPAWQHKPSWPGARVRH